MRAVRSSAARTFVTIAGRKGSQACSSSRIHCTRTGRPGSGAREQRRIGRDIVGAVVAVAARAFDMDAAHLLRAPSRSVRPAPSRSGNTPWLCVHTVELAVVQMRDRARRADRAVHD